jgi:hypothetical protein
MAMVKDVQHFAVENFFQLFQIQYEAGFRVDLAFNRYFKRVVVPVAIEVVALAEKALVLFRRKIRVVIVMRS